MSQRPLPYNTRIQETYVHVPVVVRTRNPSKRAAAELRLRPRGHRGQQIKTTQVNK
jgi:hypothetical protein